MEHDWSSILPDIGYVILCKLHEFVDQVWFGAVCKNWYSITKEYDQLTRPSHGTLPTLFITSSECETQRKLYSMSIGKVYHNVTLFDIPNKICCGSSYGWLAFMEQDLSVTLINPFKYRGITVHLPKIKADGVVNYAEVISKLIVLPNSTPDNYTVVAIYGGWGQLAIIKNGDNRWRYIVSKNHVNRKQVTLCDIMFHKGLVYAICHSFKVLSVDIHSSPIQIKILKQSDPSSVVEQYNMSYIVESTSGDLYVLRRQWDDDYNTELFKVLKLELHRKIDKVVRVVETKTLNGDSIFMNDTYSAAIKASNFDWCEPNSIYYTYDKDFRKGNFPDHGNEDSGIYNIEKKNITRLYLGDQNHKYRQNAIWVHPPNN